MPTPRGIIFSRSRFDRLTLERGRSVVATRRHSAESRTLRNTIWYKTKIIVIIITTKFRFSAFSAAARSSFSPNTVYRLSPVQHAPSSPVVVSRLRRPSSSSSPAVSPARRHRSSYHPAPAPSRQSRSLSFTCTPVPRTFVRPTRVRFRYYSLSSCVVIVVFCCGVVRPCRRRVVVILPRNLCAFPTTSTRPRPARRSNNTIRLPFVRQFFVRQQVRSRSRPACTYAVSCKTIG